MNQIPAWVSGLAALPPAQFINDSTWLFAVIQAMHLLGIVVFGGALLAVDVGILGAGFRASEIRPVEREGRPWLRLGLGLIVLSGLLMFIAEPEKCYASPVFMFKMVCFVVGLLILTTLRARTLRAFDLGSAKAPPGAKVVAALSLGVWLLVGVGGRAIGFY